MKPDSEEILIYVSNKDEDIARSDSDQDGSLTAPYSDLMRAVHFVTEAVAPYSQNSDGSRVTVRIALLPGEHFVIDRDYDFQTLTGKLNLVHF